MKIRNGFVSNSSSASFVVDLSSLTSNQINGILSYGKWIKANETRNAYDDKVAKRREFWTSGKIRKVIYNIGMFLEDFLGSIFPEYVYGKIDSLLWHDYWAIQKTDEHIFASADMDNGAMRIYLKDVVGIDIKSLDWISHDVFDEKYLKTCGSRKNED